MQTRTQLQGLSTNTAAFPVNGSGRRELVTGLTGLMSIAVEPDGSTLYWADFDTGEIDRLAL